MMLRTTRSWPLLLVFGGQFHRRSFLQLPSADRAKAERATFGPDPANAGQLHSECRLKGAFSAVEGGKIADGLPTSKLSANVSASWRAALLEQSARYPSQIFH